MTVVGVVSDVVSGVIKFFRGLLDLYHRRFLWRLGQGVAGHKGCLFGHLGRDLGAW